MKIRLMVSEEHYAAIADWLTLHGAEIDDGAECRLSDPLRRLDEMLDPQEFIRVSNSAIISINHIKSIRPSLSQKFVLTMSDGARVDVTRSYYYIFKDTLGI
ncbi:MAG: LytTR family transcriptional regulator [Oscillospiraceae bacterium]|nr:LytTR family transcriptional regulator [Oscillospiraceae bacterium]